MVSGYRPGWALVTVAVGYAIALAALFPVQIAFPLLADAFHVSISSVSWASTSFLLSLTVLALLAGRIGDLYGHKRVFVIGLVVTTLGALLCGLAPSWPLLVALRFVQGAGAALVSGNAMAIAANAVPPERRGKAIGLLTTSTSLGIVVASWLVGRLVGVMSWHAVFLVVVPFGLLALLTSLRMGPGFRPPPPPRLDWIGAVLLTLTLSTLVLSFSHFHEGPESFEAGWPYHSTMHALTVFGLALFLFWERRIANPLVDLRVFRVAPFTLSVLANLCFHMTMMSTSFMYPYLVERGFGLTATETANIVIGNNLAAMLAAVGTGALMDFLRSRVLQVFGIGLTFLSLLALALLPGLSYSLVVLVGFSLGLAGGAFQTANNAFVLSSLPPNQRGFASGMIDLTRQYGHTLGITVTTLVVAGAVEGAPSFTPVFQQAMFVTAGLAFVGYLLAFVATRRRISRLRAQETRAVEREIAPVA
ncbi:MAG: MFS transporter [Chloroflexi bacterium]|nr:MFS transporter [Chloroflexota bacterium]